MNATVSQVLQDFVVPNRSLGEALASFRQYRAETNLGLCRQMSDRFLAVAHTVEPSMEGPSRQLKMAFAESFCAVIESVQSARQANVVSDIAADRITQMVTDLRKDSQQAISEMKNGAEIVKLNGGKSMELFHQEMASKLTWLSDYFDNEFSQKYTTQPNSAQGAVDNFVPRPGG